MSNRRRPDDDEDDEKDEAIEILKSIGRFVLKTVAVAGLVIGGISAAVPLLGFTADGVAAGSAAAAYQSSALGGIIKKGSAFSKLQSVGAAGLSASTRVGIVAGSAAVVGAHTLTKKTHINK